METWYDNYVSQGWYRNTFLVHDFSQIARVNEKDREWNNIEGSGCNFVCLSMIVGINPSHLCSELSKLKLNFFRADRSLKSTKLNGDQGYLVWDQNEPHQRYKEITVKNIFHPRKGLVNLSIKFVEIRKTNEIAEANNLIAKHRSMGRHIICGYEDHSRLVAGKKNGSYFLWDPDLTERTLEDNLNGELSLDWFYKSYGEDKEYADKKAEFWIYSVDFKAVTGPAVVLPGRSISKQK